MQVVVPAAGVGSRLRPLTDDRPKALLEIDGRPLLSYTFDRLLEIDPDRIVVVIGYRGEQISSHFGTRYGGVPIEYVTQDEQLGLAHAIAQAEHAIEGCEEFLVVNGDNVFDCSLAPIVDRQTDPSVDATLLVESTDPTTARSTGVVITREDGSVAGLLEKPDDPPSTLITTGVYGLPESIFEWVRRIDPSDRGEYELPDAIDRLRRAGATVATVRLEGRRVNVNTPADLDRAATLLSD